MPGTPLLLLLPSTYDVLPYGLKSCDYIIQRNLTFLLTMMGSTQKYIPAILLAIYLLVFTVLAIEPYDRATWWVENIPVITVVLGLFLTYNKFRFSNTAYVLMTMFLCYHTIGGHWTFALTPFGLGNEFLSMLNADFIFPESRNNFDRLGHFLVGVFAYPIAELAYRKSWVANKAVAVVLAVFALGFWAALYEIIEMYYAVMAGGNAAVAFLGSQGDIWDAQKDMLLDISGAVVFALWFAMVFSGRKIR
jgi:putative membrane protein